MKTRLLIVLSLFVFLCSFANTITAIDPVAPTLQPLTYCDPNNDGFGTFDFADVSYQILAAQSSAPSNYVVGYYETLTYAQVDANSISSPYYNINPNTQTIYYRVTNINTNAFAVGSLQLIVNATPVATIPNDYHLCDVTGAVGYETFNLNLVIPEVLGTINPSNVSVSFYTSQSDAANGLNAIITASNFTNAVVWSQTLYVRVEVIATGCTDVVPLQLVVDQAPVAPVSLPMIIACDGDSNPQNGITAVDLTQQTAAILVLQPLPASNYTVTYYTTMTAAQSGTSPIINSNNYTGSNGQTIWYRLENNSTGCYNVGTFQLVVNTPLALSTPTPLSVCDSDANINNQYTTFDLTFKNNEIAQGHAGYTVTYFPSLSDAQTGTNAIANPTSYINVIPLIQTLGVVVSSPEGCASFTTLDIRVLPVPAPNIFPPALAPQCDVNNPGDLMEVFDLTVNATYITLGNPNLTLHYFRTQNDAFNGINEIINPTAALVGYNVWIRVENNAVGYNGIRCFLLVQQPLTVYPLPNPIITTNNGFNTVYVDGSNNVVQPLLLDSGVTGNYSYQWYLNGTLIAVATNSTYEVNTATANNESRSYSVSVQNNSSTGCSTTSSSFLVLQSNGVTPPSGLTSQSFAPGATLANIVVNGTNVQWYASATNKMTTSTPLPLNTPLVDGTTYYATQTIGGIESVARLPVTVHITLGVDDNEIFPIRYAPNPVKDTLTLQSSVVLKSVTVYTMVGQKVLEQNVDGTAITIDLSRLTTGNYILKVQGETGQKTLRIIKE
jgi:hypothetical protein